MAKKKNLTKKHKFKYAEPEAIIDASSAPVASSTRPPASEIRTHQLRSVTSTVPVRDFSYVGQDLRRIGIFAVALVVLETVLWALFTYTGLGTTVYNLVKL